MNHTDLADSIHRRQWLRNCGVGLLGASLAEFLSLQGKAASGHSGPAGGGKAKRCIVLYCWGGISHLDTFDMKPNAPAEIRGQFKPIATSVPGIQIGEHMPLLAQQMHRLAVVRSAHHSCTAHGKGMYWNMTGHPPPNPEVPENRSPELNDWPNLGAMVGRFRKAPRGLPAAVQLPYPLVDNGTLQAGDGPGFLGKTFGHMLLKPDKGKPYGGVSRELGECVMRPADGIDAVRMRDRLALLKNLERVPADSGTMRSFGYFQDMAREMLLSPQVQATMDLDREPTKVRDKYGDHICGQSVLMARRLVEAGVPIATVICAAGDLNGSVGDNWDTHGNNFNRLKKDLLPPLEMASRALLDDLSDRGMLDSTLVVFLTEFGRTPKVNGAAGRDHYPFCYSVAFAGGGIRGGQVYGSSDKQGAFPRDLPCGPADLHATIFTAMGISLESHLTDSLGRPFAITDGEPLPLF